MPSIYLLIYSTYPYKHPSRTIFLHLLQVGLGSTHGHLEQANQLCRPACASVSSVVLEFFPVSFVIVVVASSTTVAALVGLLGSVGRMVGSLSGRIAPVPAPAPSSGRAVAGPGRHLMLPLLLLLGRVLRGIPKGEVGRVLVRAGGFQVLQDRRSRSGGVVAAT